jgi:hydrogenase large subunit
MSHITHFYHLAALDYINASALGHPYSPSFTASDMLVLGVDATATTLVNSYVAALEIRRKAHTMGAIFSGKQPCQTAIVPGGVTTLFSSSGETISSNPGPYEGNTAINKFRSILQEVAYFVNYTYIPNVVTVADAYGSTHAGSLNLGMKDYWSYGTGYGNLLSYGDYLIDLAGNFLIQRGRVHLSGYLADDGVYPVDHNRIVEYVGYSHYKDYPLGPSATAYKHPWAGETYPEFEKGNSCGTSYSWMKAPRYLAHGTEEIPGGGGDYDLNDPIPYEVGPLARMVVSYVDGLTNTPPSLTSYGNAGGLLIPGQSYDITDLIPAALDACGVGVGNLFSVLGRHAARALEAKMLCDAMLGWLDDPNLVVGGPVYTYKPLPKGPIKGVGMVEAPRGALGHWLIADKGRIVKYQCVVPSTWNCSPRDDTGQRGAVEEIVVDAGNITNGGSLTTTGAGAQEAVVNILRLLHAHDFCGACAVHIVTPDKKVVAKINVGTDGTVTKLPIDSD